jgi:hypothetical protein
MIVTTFAGAVRAQPAASKPAGEVADAWLTDALQSEVAFDQVGRYVGAVAVGAIGSFMLAAPPLVAAERANVGAKGAATSMASGALFLGGAIGALIIGDPHRADRWLMLSTAAGCIGLGLALAVSSLEARTFLPELTDDARSGRHPNTLSISYGIGLAAAASQLGYALSFLVVELAMPPQSPSRLREQLAGLSADDRHDRIRNYLMRRDRRRAWLEYTAAAINFAAGGLTMYATGLSTEESGRVAGSWMGLTMIGYGLGSLISYWLSSDSVSRLDAGEVPN